MLKLPVEIIGLIVHIVGNMTRRNNQLFSNCSINLQDLKTKYSDSNTECDNENGDEGSNPDEKTNDPLLQTNHGKVCDVPGPANTVRTIRYTTNQDPNKFLDDYHNDEEINELGPVMRRAIHLCNRFPNLTRIEVEFARVCAFNPDIRTYGNTGVTRFRIDPEDTHEYRQAILMSLWRALSSSENPTPHLTTLSLKNLQNINDLALVTSESFTRLLNRIMNLQLRIVAEDDVASPESAW
ncbi:hypothetical protein ACMFMG_005457 [Clarireedia jacksonii]